jgi:hypothetical protein
MVVEVVQRSHLICSSISIEIYESKTDKKALTHSVDMAPILAVSPFSSFFKQYLEYRLNGLSVPRIRLIERHHVHEDDVTFMHKEVAEQIEGFVFACPN